MEMELFAAESLDMVLKVRLRRAIQVVEGEAEDTLMSTDIDEYIGRLAALNLVKPIEIFPDDAEIVGSFEKKESIRDHGRTIEVPRNYTIFAIPYRGEKDLFNYTPSNGRMWSVKGEVLNEELQVALRNSGDATALRNAFGNVASELLQMLAWQKADIDTWNRSMESELRRVATNRKDRLKISTAATAALGFKIRKRTDGSSTYPVPVIRKKIELASRATMVAQNEPQPVLEENLYIEILRTLRSMSLVIERNPSAFGFMKEEDLRMQFLIPLNAVFEGAATGETFNFEGKTDILIRHQNRNVFIAECKFWKGPKGFSETIDQLLGYLNWRDAKTAILVFVRDVGPAKVMEQIPNIVKTHSNFLSEHQPPQADEFRFKMRSSRDEHIKLDLVVQLYHVPTPPAK